MLRRLRLPGSRWVRSFALCVDANAKPKFVYRCSKCGKEQSLPNAYCAFCEAHKTLEKVEVRKSSVVNGNALVGALQEIGTRSDRWVQSTIVARPLSEIGEERDRATVRIPLDGRTGEEVARVLGGGLVPGTLVLVGGDPGVGKSTLLLQIASLIARSSGGRDSGKTPSEGCVLYISGEESPGQIYDRAQRLGVTELDALYVLSETDVLRIVEEIEKTRPRAVIMDSIQTVMLQDTRGGPGSYVQVWPKHVGRLFDLVSKVRDCGMIFSRVAKDTNIPIFLVGHVTKEGEIAGPKTLEHIVDCVLYLEGEKNQMYRILRGVKNRYGATDEIGIFEMTEHGLAGVENPNLSLLRDRGELSNDVSSALAVMLQGTRPILAEVQALCTTIRTVKDFTPYHKGVDFIRLCTICAILKKRVRCRLEKKDLRVNVPGGITLREPAGDLAIAVAIASTYFGQPIIQDAAFIGELGLGGELRPVVHLDKRLAETAQLGLKTAVIPKTKQGRQLSRHTSNLAIYQCSTIMEALEIALGRDTLTKHLTQKPKRSRSDSFGKDMEDDWEE